MRILPRPHATPRPAWAAELQDPILSDGHGPLAANDQLPAAPHHRPAAHGLCRRLHQRLIQRLALRLRVAYLRWLVHSLAQQRERAQLQLLDLAVAAHQAAQVHKRSALLTTRRQALRHQLQLLDARLADVGRELVELRKGRA